MRKRPRLVAGGLGINDWPDVLYDDNKVPFKWYSSWKNMIYRCYPKSAERSRRGSYSECTVSDEFRSITKFKLFFDENYVDGWQLDKDMLFRGNKLYSSETCIFIPQEVNIFMAKCDASRGEYPIGVSYHKSMGRLRAYCGVGCSASVSHIGYFDSVSEAHAAWQKAKIYRAEQLLEKWGWHDKIRQGLTRIVADMTHELTSGIESTVI